MGENGLYKQEKSILSAQTLKHISEFCPISIVTGRPISEAKQFLESENIFNIFKAILCMEDGPAKPDPTTLLSALDKMGILKEHNSESIYIYSFQKIKILFKSEKIFILSEILRMICLLLKEHRN